MASSYTQSYEKAMSKKIQPDQLTNEVNTILREYSDEVLEELNGAVEEVAKESRDELKVAGSFNNRSGKYRKGWTITFEKLRYGLQAIVHNKRYPLTHLLESGHAKFIFGHDTGEYVKAFPHIEQVNEEAQRKLEDEIQRRLK